MWPIGTAPTNKDQLPSHHTEVTKARRWFGTRSLYPSKGGAVQWARNYRNRQLTEIEVLGSLDYNRPIGVGPGRMAVSLTTGARCGLGDTNQSRVGRIANVEQHQSSVPIAQVSPISIFIDGDVVQEAVGQAAEAVSQPLGGGEHPGESILHIVEGVVTHSGIEELLGAPCANQGRVRRIGDLEDPKIVERGLGKDGHKGALALSEYEHVMDTRVGDAPRYEI